HVAELSCPGDYVDWPDARLLHLHLHPRHSISDRQATEPPADGSDPPRVLVEPVYFACDLAARLHLGRDEASAALGEDRRRQSFGGRAIGPTGDAGAGRRADQERFAAARAERSAVNELIIGTYGLICWLLFKKLRLV